MKKRLLSALLALALVFVLLPTTALAKVVTSDEDISIAGIDWKFGSDSEVGYFYNGNFTTDEPNGSYLKLTKNSNTITVTVYGNVTVSDIKVHKNFDIGEKINLIITGGNKRSTLTLNCTGISGAALETFQSGDITIKDGITVNANFSADNTDKYTDCYGIRASKNLIITGKGTTVNAVNADDAAAVKVDGNITVSDGAQLKATNKYSKKVTSYTDNAYAIECGGQLSISGDKTQVTAKTSNGKKAISGTVSNGDKLTFKVQLYLASSTLYQKPMDKALEYAYVEITQAPTDPYVLIAGEQAIIGQETPIPGGSGTYLYKDEGNNGSTLTLKDATINKDSIKAVQAIRFGQNGYYTIKLEGENKISGFSSGIVAPKDPGVDDVTVVLSGSGSLDISANQYAIDMQVGKLKFENTGKIKLTTGYVFTYPLNALRVKSGSITIDNTKYDIVGARQEKDYPTETISDSSVFDPAYLNGYTVGGETTLFKTITITPAAAKPSTIRYNGTTLKQGETIKDGKGGTATVATKGNTITLNNFKGTQALSFEATLADSTLVLEGTNTLSSIVTTQKGLTISGSGSLTVGYIRVTNNYNIHADLTITDSATVIAGTTTSDAKAIDITGNLTVNSGATLTATNTSETNPTIDVSGNVTISGDPGTNAYTVSAHNSCDVQKDRVGNLSPSGVPSAIKIGRTLNISAGARVMAQTDSYGAGVMLSQNSTITVEDAFLSAKNSSCDFAAISFSGQTGKIDVSGEKGEIVAENTHTGTNLRFRAINAFVYNRNTDFYLKMQSEGVIAEAVNKIIAPGEYDASGGKKVTITRGDEVTHTASPVVIAGTTLRNDTYYTITDGSTVAVGTDENNYNAFYDSETKTLKLNNAVISHSFAYEDGGGNDGAIIFTKFENYFIELSGENTISSTNTYAINCRRPDRTLTIKNAAGAENAKLTLTSNWMVVCSIGGLNIQSDVTMVNTKKADHLMYVNGTFSYTGYNAYASTEASGSPLEVYDPENYSTYKYLRITKENLAPTTPTTYTVTITTGDNMSRESGTPIQEVTKGAAISEVKFIAASGHYFPADYVSKMNLPEGFTAVVSGNSWYLTINGTPTSDVTINLPATSVRPTITVSMPTPVAGNTPATANDITLTYTPSQGSSRNLRVGSVIWESYVPDGPKGESIKVTGTLSSGDKFVEGTKYRATINFEGVSEDYAIVPAAGTTKWSNAEWGSSTMTLYFDATGAPCTHEYTDDWHANGNTHWHECKLCRAHADEAEHTYGGWITDTEPTATVAGTKHRVCSVCDYVEQGNIPATGEIVPPTPDNPGTIVIIRPAEEEKPAQQPNPSTGANDLVGLAVAAAVAAALGSAALLRKHD